MSSHDGDAARRQREINMFAAMAAGEAFPEDNDNDSSGNGNGEAPNKAIDSSGTFAMTSTPNVHEDAERSNLNAALAALTSAREDNGEDFDDDIGNQNGFGGEGASSNLSSAGTVGEVQASMRRTVKTDPIPMYTEQVLMPRPLFFGPVLPPRVLKEAREAVKNAVDAKGDTPPSLSDLPLDVRNLVGAIETYGFGLSAILVEDEENGDFWRGESYISTYQPVWGEEARADRETKQKRRRAHTSKPAEVDTLATGEQTKEQSLPATEAGQSAVETGGTPFISNRKSDRQKQDMTDNKTPAAVSATPVMDTNLFSRWARGQENSSPTISDSENEASPNSENSVASGREIREKASPTSTTPMTDTNLFSLWARGEGNSSPTSSDSENKAENKASSNRENSVESGRETRAKASPSSARVASSDGVEKRKIINNVSDKELFGQLVRGEVGDSNNASPSGSADLNGAKNCSDAAGQLDNTCWSGDEGQMSTTAVSDKELFGQWVRGEGSGSNNASPSGSVDLNGSKNSSDVAGKPEASDDGSGKESASEPVSEQELFSKWARGEEAGENTTPSVNATTTGANAHQPFDTFRPVAPDPSDSDDDSVVGGEMKKKVGVNEHLNAAVASLANVDGVAPGNVGDVSGSESITADQAKALLAQIGATTPGGRPLSNYELTNGCVPLYACDDGSLPREEDCNLFQTKEDVLRLKQEQKAHKTINQHSFPNIFGSVANPSPAMGPDDNRSWNSRTTPSQKIVGHEEVGGLETRKLSVLPVPESPLQSSKKPIIGEPSPSTLGTESVGSFRSLRSGSSKLSKSKKKKSSKRKADLSKYDSNLRFGWWNTFDGDSSDAAGGDSLVEQKYPLVQLPPKDDSLLSQVATRLTPTPQYLREQNRPLSHLHSATSIERTALPFLSDRPPSYRYLQIDTQIVGFPAVEEVEPLFCSLSIYHVEPLPGHNPKAVPLPDVHRCGRITETLHFDVVSDPQVEARCHRSLYPYPDIERTQGTRCGVFPLPSNLNIANLYAILIVQKVLSEDADLDPYLKENKSGAYELEKLRRKAEKASSRRGQFLMPFSFGVAPLVQVLGMDVPDAPRSRAVQIPLFHLISGKGDRPIIDQIMVMLNPKGEQSSLGQGGRAENSNGGTAFFVMRNFGYLGLHSVVSSKSSQRKKNSLARDRLVDFTRELQIRPRRTGLDMHASPKQHGEEAKQYVVPPWHNDVVSEPTLHCGRNVLERRASEPDGENHAISTTNQDLSSVSQSKVYAQELAPVPLHLEAWPSSSPAAAASRMRVQRGSSNARDSEPFFHTTFCNEMLCYPRVLHGSPLGRVSIRIELRELEWIEDQQAYLCHIPRIGPAIHNTRRGPVLVQEAYSSCATNVPNPHFLDEFKVRLPLLLQRENTPVNYVLLFSACYVHLKSKKTWSEMIKGAKGSIDDDCRRSKVNTLACGFVPITSLSDSCCLIGNGLHDIKLAYTSKEHLPEETTQADANSRAGTLILTKLPESKTQKVSAKSRRDVDGSIHSSAEGADEESMGSTSDRQIVDTDDWVESSYFGSESVTSETPTDSELTHWMTPAAGEHMTLQARIIVHSSVHPQSASLSEFLRRIPSNPGPPTPKFIESPAWNLDRTELLEKINALKHVSENDSGGDDAQRLLLFTMDIAKNALCSQAEATMHFLRIAPQLVKTMVSGAGDSSLLWANPASHVSLRVHSFSTLLQILFSVNNFLLKNGVTQVDGKSKWNMASLGRVFVMLFDEGKLFGAFDEQHGEVELDKWVSQRKNKRKDDLHVLNFHPQNWTPSESIQTGKAQGKTGTVTGSLSEEDRLHSLLSGFASLPASREKGVATFNQKSELPRPSETVDHVKPSEKPESNKQVKLQIDSKADFQSALWAGSSQSSDPESKRQADFRIDSKADFQSALWAGSAESSDFAPTGTESMDKTKTVYTGWANPSSNRRKWMTLPSSALATIREDFDDSGGSFHLQRSTSPEAAAPVSSAESSPPRGADILDAEIVRLPTGLSGGATKTMRVPRVRNSSSERGGLGPTATSIDDQFLAAGSRTNKPMLVRRVKTTGSEKEITRPRVASSDEQIFAAGSQFLNVIGETFGAGTSSVDAGAPQHKRARSRCSIDWTLPDLGDGASGPPVDAVPLPNSEDKTIFSEMPDKVKVEDEIRGLGDFDAESLKMSSLSEEESNTIDLPDFASRVSKTCKSGSGRWYPYTYEVLILQWVALLDEQRRAGEKAVEGSASRTSAQHEASDDISSLYGNCLADAALRAKGATVACAPALFEIIKKSIGWRVDLLYRQATRKGHGSSVKVNPLVGLDTTLLSQLEKLISMLTDACLDSRNFDSWDFRRTSIEVNDSIVRFLRDLFGLLETKSVYHLILVYLSRFVVREGKLWQDRDSKIGLKCSWEICKLRLNAASVFVRFPDFIRINAPIFGSLPEWSLISPANVGPAFFDRVLEKIESFSLPGFTSTEGPSNKMGLTFPQMKPHWMAELVADICLSGVDHREQAIQHRATSLLHELFWSSSQMAQAQGTSAAVAAMYLPFVVKVLWYIDYLSRLPPKSQIRRDLLPCVVYVLQCAPPGLKCALWRKLLMKSDGKGADDRFGGVGDAFRVADREDFLTPSPSYPASSSQEERSVQSSEIYDVFGLLNLVLSTFEYEGGDDQLEIDLGSETTSQMDRWKKDFLLTLEQDNERSKPSRNPVRHGGVTAKSECPKYSTCVSRRWHAHDAAIVVVSTTRQILREMKSLNSNGMYSNVTEELPSRLRLTYTHDDTVIFVRAAASVYLHALSLRQSDVVVARTISAANEIVTVFGINVFLLAVGETLQHWMRVVSIQCGARRELVRLEASNLLSLLLRASWDKFGSFSRVRLPLLAVQTEVMERIVATAATCFYREQRRMGIPIQYLSNDSAEACLAPLWLTLQRIITKPASHTSIPFNNAQKRLAENMKKLCRGYVAAHALSTISRTRSGISPNTSMTDSEDAKISAWARSRLLVVQRIVNAAGGYSKRFIGLRQSESEQKSLAHSEAVEDAFLDASHVFAPAELPQYRVAWLRKLAEFHSWRSKYAEEATCRFHIHLTLRRAARLHNSLWSSSPFLPWTKDVTDMQLGGEGAAGEVEEYYDADYDFEDRAAEEFDLSEIQTGMQIEKSNAFRRIFYRVPNSIQMRTGDWEMGNKNICYGVTFPAEYRTVSPWISRRELEEEMVDEAESAGDLFLKAGIIESSRYAWSMATNIYAEKYDYGRLALAYKRLSTVMSSRVPVIDADHQSMDLSHPLGRFYRVWFHGNVVDDLLGCEYVYRVASSVKLEEFCKELVENMRIIMPENIPIHLDSGDGKEYREPISSHARRFGLVAPQGEATIKVTALRPLLRQASRIRGTPEWFDVYSEIPFAGSAPSFESSWRHAYGKLSSFSFAKDCPTQHREREGSFGSAVFASSGSMSSGGTFSHALESGKTLASRDSEDMALEENGRVGSELVGVSRFSFLQQTRRVLSKSSKDWLKTAGDISEKSFKVTYLQVEQAFPASKSRQSVSNRSVSWKSPIENGVDAICSWCSVLFRTAVATNGMAVLGASLDQGIGKSAAKVVSECIYKSRAKDIGLVLLQENGFVPEENDLSYGLVNYVRLTDAEMSTLQRKLARGLLHFIELLHILISRNRDLLLEAMEAKKQQDAMANDSFRRVHSSVASPEVSSRHSRYPSNMSGLSSFNDGFASSVDGNLRYHDDASAVVASSTGSAHRNEHRTEKAIAVQRELQRGFISMAKALQPNISSVLREETPQWLKQACQESYFSSHTYRQTKTRMSDEIFFSAAEELKSVSPEKAVEEEGPMSLIMSLEQGTVTSNSRGSPGGSLHEGSVRSRGTAERLSSWAAGMSSPLHTESSLFQV